MRYFLLFFVLFGSFAKTQLLFDQKNTELGLIAEACEIKGDVIVSNTSQKKVFLLRADAEKGLKIYTSKKTLAPGDTCLLVISFIPESGGKFKKKIDLVASDKDTPYTLSLSGSVAKVKTNDLTACYYFGHRRNSQVDVKEEVIPPDAPQQNTDYSNRLPGSSPPHVATEKPAAPKEPAPQKFPEPVTETAFTEKNYRPNNLLFLVDISSSMRDSLKLPVMKTALHQLIDAIRTIDSISFVTYADTVKVIREAVSGLDKQMLHASVDALKAKGMTKGRKAILFSQKLAQKHFIREGNNQIIIATDGKFKFEDEDFKKWKDNQGDKKIIISTVAFGDEKEAIKNLKEIASKGGGSFIHMKKRSGSGEKLLNEIKEKSKR